MRARGDAHEHGNHPVDGRARRGRVGGHGLDGEPRVSREGNVAPTGDRLPESEARRLEPNLDRGNEAVRMRAIEGRVARIEAQRNDLAVGGC